MRNKRYLLLSPRYRVSCIRRFLGLIVCFVALLSIWFQGTMDISYNRQMSLIYEIKRSRLDRMEFHHKTVSPLKVDSFFYVNESLITGETFGQIHPWWVCDMQNQESVQQQRMKKIIFPHMPRSGGALVKGLLRGYAHFCHAGLVMVSRCVDLGFEYIVDDPANDTWINGKMSSRAGQECILSLAENRTGHPIPINVNRTLSTDFLKQHEIDIVAGYIPLGLDYNWNDPTGQRFPTQYILFFRNPLEKLVSNIMFIHRTQNLTSIDQQVDLIEKLVQQELNQGRYSEHYSHFLITPEQNAWMERNLVPWTPERRLNLSMANLLQLPVAVGIAERLSQSIELIQYLLDPQGELSILFGFFAVNATRQNDVYYSKKQTEAIVERIREDPTLSRVMAEYLQYEQQLYGLALQLHERQIENIAATGWRSFRES